MAGPRGGKKNAIRRTAKENFFEKEIDAKVARAIDKFHTLNPDIPLPDDLLSELKGKTYYYLGRYKRAEVENSIRRVLDFRSQQQNESQGVTDNSDDDANEGEDSEFENKEGAPMMVVEDKRDMNRSLLSMYTQHMATAPDHMAAGIAAVTLDGKIVGYEKDACDTAMTTRPISGIERVDAAKPNDAHTASSKTISSILDTPRKGKRRQGNAAGHERSKRKKDETETTFHEAPSARISDLGGLDACIEEVLELVAMPLRHPEIFHWIGIPPPRGLLLHGPPGCGKTLLANALAGDLGVPFFNISAPSVVSGMSGESEKKIREVFNEAKECAPCILFIDEIDAISPKRENAQREMERRIVAQLLTCMDEISWEKTNFKPVIVIGATNRPDSLDPALRRGGRFDREICLGVPDEASRVKILKVLSAKLRLSGSLDFETLARMTPGYVGADLNALTSAAGMNAVKRAYDAIRRLGEEKERTWPNEENGSTMDIDAAHRDENIASSIQGTKELVTARSSVFGVSTAAAARTMSRFLAAHPDPLKESELEAFQITNDDFIAALKKVQPSSKREGFATVPDVTWADIGALDEVRKQLRLAVVYPIQYPRLFERVGITAPTGVLLWGPPGCGKTLLAKAVANESHTNFISVKGPELLNKYVGESERAVRQVFARARASAPCVVFFDEFDALCSRRDESQSEVSSRMVNTLLTELDGMEGRKQVFIIAATNRPDIIDGAMLRPGRLDKLLYVELPTASERRNILHTLATRNRTPLADEINLDVIAQDPRLEGYSGADLASLLREASVSALRERLYFIQQQDQSINTATTSDADNSSILVRQEHFVEALGRVLPSVPEKDRRMYERLKMKMGGRREVAVNALPSSLKETDGGPSIDSR